MSPCVPCHSRRQLRIRPANRSRYATACESLFAFDSPWYQITPLIGNGSNGCSMRLYRMVGTLLMRCASAAKETAPTRNFQAEGSGRRVAADLDV